MRIVVITGLSGSGKSTAVKALEDEGFFCIDNLPVTLIPTFIELVERSKDQVRDVALVMDIRGKDFLKGWEEILLGLRSIGHNLDILFFDTTDEVLIRRFSETRRRHPALPGASVPDAIRFERESLAGLHRIATRVFDTSEMNVHQLKETVLAFIRGEDGNAKRLTVHVQSFGFRYGLPLDSDLVIDVRFLPNPYFVESLKKFSGQEPKVKEFVLEQAITKEFLVRYRELLDLLLPGYQREGKTYLTLSVGCTGGRHRSVAIAEELKNYFTDKNVELKVTHRDIEKG
ncbi:RNase adapter RapZ [Geobacter pelophilus]|uniref:RNase adapter RapZ n=1 Tax=Geoanaerobacter pelophilus TaxID=60036 RepID=A0AAW4L3T2_9BACT|nr:RNase adapter RapZ [Geoanaerobacter pelophilus]MBT0663265.1 RNase adapter RapZ [Geoanaerobacter pelophilus]